MSACLQLQVFLLPCLCFYLFFWLPACLSSYRCAVLFVCLPSCLSLCLLFVCLVWQFVSSYVCVPSCLPSCPSVFMSVCFHVFCLPSIRPPPSFLSVCLLVCLTICLPVFLPVCLPACLPTCLPVYLPSRVSAYWYQRACLFCSLSCIISPSQNNNNTVARNIAASSINRWRNLKRRFNVFIMLTWQKNESQNVCIHGVEHRDNLPLPCWSLPSVHWWVGHRSSRGSQGWTGMK